MTRSSPTPLQKLLIAELTRVGSANPTQLAAATGLSVATASACLARLERLDLVHSYIDLCQHKTRIYTAGVRPLDDDAPDTAPMKRIYCATWAPHHFRDSLVAALFGEVSTA